MPLPPLKITTAQVTLNVPVDEPTPRDTNAKTQLNQAVADVQTRLEPELVPETPPEVPFLILSGRSSQAQFSQIQADLSMEFFDHYQSSSELCRKLVAEKGATLIRAWARIEAQPVWEGIVIKLRAPMNDPEDTPVHHLFATQLRADFDDCVREAKIQIALGLQDRYYATIAVNPYESRRVQVAGPRSEPIRAWEGEVTERGVEVVVDVNNRYRAVLEKKFMRVTEADLVAMNDLAWQVVDEVATPFAREGELRKLTATHEAAV
jgi:hypothetical protein